MAWSIDNTQSNAGTAGTTVTITGFSVGSLTNGIGVVASFAQKTGGSQSSPSSITWNGSAMTKVTNQGNSTGKLITDWWYILGPTTGDIVATWSVNQDLGMCIIARSYSGAQQSGQPDAGSGNTGNQNSNVGNQTTLTQSLTTVNDGALVLAALLETYTTNTSSFSNLATNEAVSNFSCNIANDTKSPAGSDTVTWTASGNYQFSAEAMNIMSLIAAAGGAAHNTMAKATATLSVLTTDKKLVLI